MQKYTAIILAWREANEFDRIYFLYTKEIGLVRAVGRGVRKPNAKLTGHLEPGTLSEVYVARSRGMGQITSAITLDGFENIKKDFGKLAEFLKIARFFLKNFSEEEKDEKVFELLRDFLDLINQGFSKAKLLEDSQSLALGILVEAFWWKLFDALGNRPEVMKCVNCKEKMRANSKKFFSAEKGGVVCDGCESKFQELFSISDSQIKLLRIFWGNPLSKIAKVKIKKEELEKLARIRENFRKYNF